ncbi:MAG: CopG family transcriptional regulator [Deltaproteobacteria bacterium]|nr:CopG family transcriptional regulator [Deltaproteobacteria bacterium]
MTARILSVRLDSETARRLEALADEERKPRSEVVREAIRARIGSRPIAPLRPFDVVADRVGCADSGRIDLSTRASVIIRERLRARQTRSR